MSATTLALVTLAIAGAIFFLVVVVSQWFQRVHRRLAVADYRAGLGPAPPPDACGPQAVWGTVQTHFCTLPRGHSGRHSNAEYLWIGADSAVGPASVFDAIIRRGDLRAGSP